MKIPNLNLLRNKKIECLIYNTLFFLIDLIVSKLCADFIVYDDFP